MTGGYTEKILVINVNNQSITKEKTNMEDAKRFIGAKGLGAKILFDRLPTKVDPLSSKNILILATGPLTGTLAQTSGRGTIVTKSPQTNIYLDSHFGGTLAAEMKKAGWDFILIEDQSDTPIYLVIKDNVVEFKDASALWGNECLKTHNTINKNEGKVRTAVIGPAGENLVKFSAITIDGHRHAGRGGAGAVMGSKNLKAIAIRGSDKVPIHDPEKFRIKATHVLKKIQENDFVPIRRQYGTPYWVKPINDWGFIPTKNYQEGYYEYGDELSATTMQDTVVDGSGACWNCVIACWNKSSIKSGPHKGISLVGPEYETLALMGSNLWIDKIEDVAYLNERCNELGMDTISIGGVLGFAIEAFEKDILTRSDFNGLTIGWGKTEELAILIDDIAHRKSIGGKILSEGVQIGSKKLGKGSEEFAVHTKGLEIPGYDPRGAFGMGLAYATSDRGGCHQRAWTAKAEVMDPALDRFSFKKKAKLVKEVQDERAAFFSLVFCDFAPISEKDCVQLLNLATGFNYSIDSYLQAGERIWNLIRLFNLREGLNTKEDKLPNRFFKKSFSKGPTKGMVISEDDFQKSLQEYYSLRGWNTRGIPTTEKIKELGLSKYV